MGSIGWSGLIGSIGWIGFIGSIGTIRFRGWATRTKAKPVERTE
jgi:hypothetical protein